MSLSHNELEGYRISVATSSFFSGTAVKTDKTSFNDEEEYGGNRAEPCSFVHRLTPSARRTKPRWIPVEYLLGRIGCEGDLWSKWLKRGWSGGHDAEAVQAAGKLRFAKRFVPALRAR